MSEHDRRFTPCAEIQVETRADGGSTSTAIKGYAAVYYDPADEGTEFSMMGGQIRERILPGTFARALGGDDDVVALANHNDDRVLGRLSAGTLKLEDTARGLRYTIRLGNTTTARDTLEDIRLGNVTGSSFAFDVLDDEWRHMDDGTVIRTLKAVRLMDVGPVTMPAYKATTAEAASRLERTAAEFLKRERLTQIRERGIYVVSHAEVAKRR